MAPDFQKSVRVQQCVHYIVRNLNDISFPYARNKYFKIIFFTQQLKYGKPYHYEFDTVDNLNADLHSCGLVTAPSCYCGLAARFLLHATSH